MSELTNINEISFDGWWQSLTVEDLASLLLTICDKICMTLWSVSVLKKEKGYCNEDVVKEFAEQIYFNGDIVFPLQKLVDLGMYETIDSAREGFLNSADKLLKITIGGETFKGKKRIKNEKGPLFIYRKVENGICTITINPELNPYFIAQYFTLLPNWS